MVTLEKGIKKLSKDGIVIDDSRLAQFRKYIDLILGWNRKAPLISYGDEARIAQKHILPSLSLLKLIPEKDEKWLDIGSGAGFPAIPIKIFRDSISLDMLEVNGKKHTFLTKTIRDLELNRCNVIQSRLENLPDAILYNLITAWAVEKPEMIIREASRILHPEGRIIYLKDRRGVAEFENFIPPVLKIADVVKLPNFTRSPRLYAIIIHRSN